MMASPRVSFPGLFDKLMVAIEDLSQARDNVETPTNADAHPTSPWVSFSGLFATLMVAVEDLTQARDSAGTPMNADAHPAASCTNPGLGKIGIKTREKVSMKREGGGRGGGERNPTA